MKREQTELRAERLRVALHVLEVADDYDAGKYTEPAPVVAQHEVALYCTLSVEDRQLAAACLDAERSLRRREWEALEVLLASLPPGGALGDLYDLPAEQALPALRAAHACGWLRDATA